MADGSPPFLHGTALASDRVQKNYDAALRSCVTCRKRKVKCDRKLSCGHCARSVIPSSPFVGLC